MKSNSFSKTIYVFIAASGIALVSVLPVIIMNKGNLYLTGDYMTQQIPFIHECRRMLLSGKPFWSNNTFLGANFWGTYSFYNFASPFYWFIYMFPEKLTGLGLTIVFIFRQAVAASTSHIYFKKHTELTHFAFIGALIYAFSSFTLDSTYYFHFIDAIAVFPLIPYLIDEVLDNRKMPWLALTAMLNAVINYYFFFITSVFFIIYLVFRTIHSKKHKLNDALRCIAFYALGGLAAMFILLPSALSLLETVKATSSFSDLLIKGMGCIPQTIKLLKGIVLPCEGISVSSTGVKMWVYNSNNAFLPFFGATFIFIAIKKSEKLWCFRLLKFLFILTLIPFGNGVFSFFTNLSYTRWWYSFVLISTLVSIKVLEAKPTHREVKQSTKTILIITIFVMALPLLLKSLFAYLIPDTALNLLPASAADYLIDSGLTQKFTAENLKHCTILIFLAIANYLPLHISIKNKYIFSRKIVPVVAAICTLNCCVYLAVESQSFDTKNYKGSETSANQLVSYTHRTQFDYGFANYAAVINMPSTTAFSSFKSKSTAEFCRLAGYKNTMHITAEHYYTTPAIQIVLNIKNIVDKNGNETAAPYYSPFGYAYDYYVIDNGLEYTTDVNENNKRIEIMAEACFVDTETAKKISDVVKEYSNSKPDLNSACIKNAKTAVKDFEMNSSGFGAISSGDKKRLIYFSVPHDSGWNAYIDGTETEILTLNGGMMGIIVPEGEHNIDFRFIPPGLNSGILISLVSLVTTAVYLLLRKRKP